MTSDYVRSGGEGGDELGGQAGAVRQLSLSSRTARRGGRGNGRSLALLGAPQI